MITTPTVKIELNKYKIDFVKKLTGKEDTQEALEDFTMVCFQFSVDVNKILDMVKEDVLEGYGLKDQE